MTPWCDDLVCSWRRLLADRHSLPFPWTLSLHRRWCPSASHHPLTFLFLLALTFPLPSPFPSLGLSLCRPPCPSASPHSFPGGGGFGMTPWCDDLVCSWRRLLADRHSLPFPWTLSLHRRWCPSASHHPLTFLFLLALTFPLPSPFPSLGLSLCRPPCPSASPHSFPSLSLGRLCQRSPRTYPVSLLCVESTQRKANAFAVGQVRARGGGRGGVPPLLRWLSAVLIHPCHCPSVHPP